VAPAAVAVRPLQPVAAVVRLAAVAVVVGRPPVAAVAVVVVAVVAWSDAVRPSPILWWTLTGCARRPAWPAALAASRSPTRTNGRRSECQWRRRRLRPRSRGRRPGAAAVSRPRPWPRPPV